MRFILAIFMACFVMSAAQAADVPCYQFGPNSQCLPFTIPMVPLGGALVPAGSAASPSSVAIIGAAGTATDRSQSALGTTAVAVAALNASRKYLLIQLQTAAVSVACTFDGTTAVLGAAGVYTLFGQGATLSYSAPSFVPTGQISCIASAAGVVLTAKEF